MLSLSFVGLFVWLTAALGLQLGIPPEKEEPILAYIAPEECLLYTSWSTMAMPSATSGNQTEQLLAEPEVKKFLTVVETTVTSAAVAAAKNKGIPHEQADQIAKTAQFWLRTVLTKSGAVYVSRFEPRDNELEVQAAMIIKAGDTAVELDRSFTTLWSQGQEKPTETTVAGRPFHKLSLEAEKLDLVWGANNGYMMIGLGAEALDEMSSRIRTRQEPSWLTQVKSNLPVERRSTVTYVNIRKLIQNFAPLGGFDAERVISALRLKHLHSFQAVSGLDDSGMLSRALVAIDGYTDGILSLLGERGITAADLQHIPADSLAAFALALDSRKLHDTVLDAMAQIESREPPHIKEQLQQFAAQLGIQVTETLTALGTKWTFFSQQGQGGLPAMAITVDVRDKQRLLELERQLKAKLLGPGGEIPNVARVTQTQIGGQPASTLTFQAPQMAMVSPTWCITDKQVIVATSPQVVQTVMASQMSSLADKPEVSARLAGSSGLLMLTYQDTPRSFAAGYQQVQTMLPTLKMIARQSSIPLELDAPDLPTQQTIVRHLRPSVMTLRHTARGLESESRRTIPTPTVGISTGVMVALLLPAVQAAREAARRTQSANNMKLQGLALHNHVDAVRTLPPSYTVSNDGKPLLSWRVALLPYLEKKELYDQFHLDEPWDSPHNKQLIEKMPKIFRSPNSTAKPGMTTYLGVGGERGLLVPPTTPQTKNGIRFSAIIDGLSNTIMIVEASDELAVEWTRPVDFAPDPKDPLKGRLGARPGGFLATFADGHTQFISRDIPAETLSALFSRDDGKKIEWPPPGPAVQKAKAASPRN